MSRILRIISSIAVLLFASMSIHAQDLTGSWQGTRNLEQKLRIILQIEKGENASRKGSIYSIDQSTNSMPVTTLSLSGATVKFSVDRFTSPLKESSPPTATPSPVPLRKEKPFPSL
jgi:hypothetical protein